MTTKTPKITYDNLISELIKKDYTIQTSEGFDAIHYINRISMYRKDDKSFNFTLCCILRQGWITEMSATKSQPFGKCYFPSINNPDLPQILDYIEQNKN